MSIVGVRPGAPCGAGDPARGSPRAGRRDDPGRDESPRCRARACALNPGPSRAEVGLEVGLELGRDVPFVFEPFPETPRPKANAHMCASAPAEVFFPADEPPG